MKNISLTSLRVGFGSPSRLLRYRFDIGSGDVRIRSNQCRTSLGPVSKETRSRTEADSKRSRRNSDLKRIEISTKREKPAEGQYPAIPTI
jgi:hypothetical protein